MITPANSSRQFFVPASTTRRGFLLGTVGVAGAALFAACGGDDESDPTGAGGTGAGTGTTSAGSGSAPAGMTAATAAMLPITDVAPFFLAKDKGYFGDAGLEMTEQFAAGGAVILPSVESGEVQVGYSNIVSLLLFASQGGKVKLVAGGGKTATGDERDYSEMWVLEDSELQDLSQLGGKTVAINTLKNALEIVTRASVEEAGGDQASINFVEIPFPEMRAALEEGQIDAMLYNEPFQTILDKDGIARSIGKPFNVAAGGEILAYYFVKEENAGNDVTSGFGEAMGKANADAAADPDVLRAIIPTYAEVPEDIAAALILPPYVEDSIPESSLSVYAELMTKYGLVEEMPDFEALLP